MGYSMHEASVSLGSRERSMYAALSSLCRGAVFEFETMTSRAQRKASPSLGFLKVPVFGKRHLDLHKLFVEVTTRGGIEQVTKARQLKQVGRCMGIPSAATNVSFMLRKFYYMLLYEYEQVYFFGATGRNSTTGGLMEDAPSSSIIPAKGLMEPDNLSVVEAASGHVRGKTSAELNPEASSQYPKGAPVVGVVDSDFSEGYSVTVTIGGEKLKGIIFKTPGQPSRQLPEHSDTGATSRDSMDTIRRHQQHEKAPRVRKRNPPKSMLYRSGYNLFFREQHAKLKPQYQGKTKEMTKVIDDLWNNLAKTEKAVYHENGLKFEARYKSEMKEYREKLKLSMNDILSEAVPSTGKAALPNSALQLEKGESHRGLDINRTPSPDDSQEDQHDN